MGTEVEIEMEIEMEMEGWRFGAAVFGFGGGTLVQRVWGRGLSERWGSGVRVQLEPGGYSHQGMLRPSQANSTRRRKGYPEVVEAT